MPRYTAAARALHWLHAPLVLGLLALGWWMGTLPKGPDFSAAVALHKSLGLCALALVVARLAWRRGHPPPPEPDFLPAWQRRAASLVHGLLYVLLLLAPVAGYLSASFTKYPTKFFGLLLPRPWAVDDALNAVFNAGHRILVLALAVTAALHIAAALYHGLRRDGILSRMLPGRDREPG